LRVISNIFFIGKAITAKIFRIPCQNPKNTGRNSFPTVISQPKPPSAMPAKYAIRRSPLQIPKPTYSQPKKAAITKIKSANQLLFRRRGRKNP
jgi:hypothetical protein